MKQNDRAGGLNNGWHNNYEDGLIGNLRTYYYIWMQLSGNARTGWESEGEGVIVKTYWVLHNVRALQLLSNELGGNGGKIGRISILY